MWLCSSRLTAHANPGPPPEVPARQPTRVALSGAERQCCLFLGAGPELAFLDLGFRKKTRTSGWEMAVMARADHGPRGAVLGLRRGGESIRMLGRFEDEMKDALGLENVGQGIERFLSGGDLPFPRACHVGIGAGFC